MTIKGRPHATIRGHRVYSRRAVDTSAATDYRRLRNRCQVCGHRLEMHNATRCLVVTNQTSRPIEATDRPCRCDAV